MSDSQQDVTVAQCLTVQSRPSPLGCVVVLSFEAVVQSVFVVQLEDVGLVLSLLLLRQLHGEAQQRQTL